MVLDQAEYRIPGDPSLGNWPVYEGKGAPPEPYLRKEIRATKPGETEVTWGTIGPKGKFFTYPNGARKVMWVLVGDHPALHKREYASFGADGLPEFIVS